MEEVIKDLRIMSKAIDNLEERVGVYGLNMNSFDFSEGGISAIELQCHEDSLVGFAEKRGLSYKLVESLDGYADELAMTIEDGEKKYRLFCLKE